MLNCPKHDTPYVAVASRTTGRRRPHHALRRCPECVREAREKVALVKQNYSKHSRYGKERSL